MQKTIHKNSENQGAFPPMFNKTISVDTITHSFDTHWEVT